MEHAIQAEAVTKRIEDSSLRLGGRNPAGERISFTNYYMEWNGKPYIPICGEFHYSRYPMTEWETELRKMKAAGINVIATYIFWNHHEELEGDYDWQGNKNLREFVTICGRNGLYVILRIGPFCHGEVRNGGLPDWLFGRAFDVRSNDAGYMSYVKRLYQAIGMQAAGLLFKDGGPVIGIQLENEYQAAAALWELTAKQGDEYLSGGSGGAEHMRLLKAAALDAGLEVPIYTSTGWGGAPVLEDEILPLYGGYAYTPWTISDRNAMQKPTGEYLFASYHQDETAVRDFDPPYPKSKYPFACCEMGGGMQAWYLARFQVEPQSVVAMSLVKVAGGCNFIGYYMFHGGTNPVGKTGYLNESTTPRMTYDFQAPIGEFGQVRTSGHLLRPLHYALQRFGDRIAPMATALPDGGASLRPEDTDRLRYALRSDGKSGFLFVNNYQDHVEMIEHSDVTFKVDLAGETIRFPRKPMTIRKNAAFMLPIRMDLSGVSLRYATAQPVTALSADGTSTYFFWMQEGLDGEFAIDLRDVTNVASDSGVADYGAEDCCTVTIPYDRSAMIHIERKDGTEVRIYAMSAQQGATLWDLEIDGCRRILFSNFPVAAADGGLELSHEGEEAIEFCEYVGSGGSQQGDWVPDGDAGLLEAERDGDFVRYRMTLAEQAIPVSIERIRDDKVVLRFDPAALLKGFRDVIVRIDYTGNVGYAFSGGQLIHDHFHNGSPWEIGLARFEPSIQSGEIVLETTPLRTGLTTLADDAGMAAEQNHDGEKYAEFHRITFVPVRGILLRS
jgi:beta-galactosidase